VTQPSSIYEVISWFLKPLLFTNATCTATTRAHLFCATWLPETYIADNVAMEPVGGIQSIAAERFKLTCTVCRTRDGACIQCAFGGAVQAESSWTHSVNVPWFLQPLEPIK
jgi:hypothetical protein